MIFDGGFANLLRDDLFGTKRKICPFLRAASNATSSEMALGRITVIKKSIVLGLSCSRTICRAIDGSVNAPAML